MKFLLSRVAVLGGTVLLFGLVFASTASASDGNRSRVQVIQVQDRCDPVTFAQNDVPCVAHSNGNVPFLTLIGLIRARPAEALGKRDADGWRFHPDEIEVKLGTTLMAVDVGGEQHTFTEVDHFVNSCIPPIAAIFAHVQPPLPVLSDAQCGTLLATTSVFPVGFPAPPPTPNTVVAHEDELGTEMYQCLIHPWMRLTVRVEPD
jgi:hypothetical protein